MGTVAGTVRGTMRKFSSCGPEQAASANAPAMIDKMFFAFIILKPFTGLDNTANSLSMFHDALHDSCGVHGEKMPEKAKYEFLTGRIQTGKKAGRVLQEE